MRVEYVEANNFFRKCLDDLGEIGTNYISTEDFQLLSYLNTKKSAAELS